MYFAFYASQFIFVYPVIVTNLTLHTRIKPLTYIGIAVWLVGFLFETIADAQMARFKANPENKGKIITTGLFKFSRHPNYFGDSLIWFSFAIIGGVWWFIFSPVIFSLLLRFASVPQVEAKYLEREDFKAYAERTSAFVPWFPKADAKEKETLVNA